MPSEATFKTVIDSLDSGVILLDQDLCLLFANAWVNKRSNQPINTALHRALVVIFPELKNSYLMECCNDALQEGLPKQLSHSFNPSLLPLYDPNHLGDNRFRLQQSITVRPININGQLACELMIYDVTNSVIKENWLKRIAANFLQEVQQKDTSLEHFSRIVENTSDAIIVFNQEGFTEFTNTSARHLFGIQSSQQYTSNLGDLLSIDKDKHQLPLYHKLMAELEGVNSNKSAAAIPSVNIQLRDIDGAQIPVELRFSCTQDGAGKKLITTIRDCSYLVETERNYRASENRFRTLAKIAPVAIFRTCELGTLRYANESWCNLTGRDLLDLHQINWLECLVTEDRNKVLPKWLSLRNNRVDLREEVKVFNSNKKGSEPTWVLCNIMAEYDLNNQISGFVGTFTDITQQRSNQDEIQRLAYRDTLTGLPNRRFFRDTLEQQIRVNRRDNKPFALFSLDLNGFKQINDTLGHDAGDAALKAVAQQMQNLLRESATISRVGGDEFCVLIPEFDDTKALAAIAKRIYNIAKEPIKLHNQEVALSTSIGIAIFPNDAETTKDLIKYADLALYAAKDNRHHPFIFFDPSMNNQINTNHSLLLDLENAVTEEQFNLYLSLRSGVGNSVSASALLRWQHANWGELCQPDFINTLECSRFVKPFNLLSIEQSFNAIARAQVLTPHLEQFCLTIHFKAFQLLESSFIDDIQTMLQRYAIPARQIEIELTEKSAHDFFSSLLPTLLKLHQLGFKLSLTEFSASYLSLQKISQLPLSVIRLCPVLLDQAKTNLPSQVQLCTIFDLSNRLDLEIHTDGGDVESYRKLLTKLNCHHFTASKKLPAQPWSEFFATLHPSGLEEEG